jgi:4-amino-4-deoxychorismate lyase
MCLLIETIRVENRRLQNMEFHNFRFNNTRKDLFRITQYLDLREVIEVPDNLTDKTYKCRLLYSDKIYDVEFNPYKIKQVNTIQLVQDNEIEYMYKFLDRSALEALKNRSLSDEILIIKNGYLTDTSISNIVFNDGDKWVTPSKYLLNGTMRQKLLLNHLITEANLTPGDLKYFSHLKLINTMLDLENSPDIQVNAII